MDEYGKRLIRDSQKYTFGLEFSPTKSATPDLISTIDKW